MERVNSKHQFVFYVAYYDFFCYNILSFHERITGCAQFGAGIFRFAIPKTKGMI